VVWPEVIGVTVHDNIWGKVKFAPGILNTVRQVVDVHIDMFEATVNTA
jgi:hypothetical protein